MEIVTWNIQCGLGVDGARDLGRIARTIRGMGDPDVICLQEVARHMAEADGGAGADQVAQIAALFPDHRPIFGAALDWDGEGGRRRQFGNLVLSRCPVVQIFRHLLPQPPQAGVRHMQRQATEVVVATASGALRVATTHLEYHSQAQRAAQVERLAAMHQEVCANLRQPPRAVPGSPYAVPPRPAEAVFCGDFNMEPEDPVYARLLADFDDGTPRLHDAWLLAKPDRPHDPTCGIFDRVQWQQGPHCRDFFFVTTPLADRVAAIEVETETQASDHQPLRLVLGA